MTSALNQITNAAARWRLWTTFAWEDVKTSYRRSLIGVLWISLSFTIFVAVKVLIFGAILRDSDAGAGHYFGAYIMLGFFVWQFMNQVINSAPGVFLSAEGWIRNDPIELPVFVFQAVTRSLFDLILTGLVVVFGLAYFGYGLHANTLLVIPALIVLTLNAGWVTLFLGVICTRFRDIGHLIQAIMRVFFFLTPIFWMPSQLGEQIMAFLWWNPFAHFIWIVRTPILDQDPALASWIFVGVLTLAGWAIALTSFALFRKRIVFWF